MKKIVKLVSYAFVLILCAQTVHADVIWEPDNSFYQKHWEECEVVEREFVANGPDGEVVAYKSPESAEEIGILKNGETTWITWSYTDEDGIVWGCPNKMENAWIPMDNMTVIYDYISFAEEYADKIVAEEGTVDKSYMGKNIYIWKYPGSETGTPLLLDSDLDWQAPPYYSTFVDESGRKWGFCGYYYGMRNFWVCLDNPEADYVGLYGEDVSEDVEPEVNMQPIEDVAPIVPKENFPLGLIGAGVGAVVVITGVVLIKMKKKSRVQ